MNALALTDRGNLYEAIEFYSECKAKGINPIIGYEAYVAPGKRTEREARRRGEAACHLPLLAKNRTGFRKLVKMGSAAFLEGYRYLPRIDQELLAAPSSGLSGCASSEFSEAILRDELDEPAGSLQDPVIFRSLCLNTGRDIHGTSHFWAIERLASCFSFRILTLLEEERSASESPARQEVLSALGEVTEAIEQQEHYAEATSNDGTAECRSGWAETRRAGDDGE